jgi:hypothetical protein
MHRFRRALAIPFLACALILPGAGAQDKPAQIALGPIGEPFQHTDEPVFAFAIPKKKKQFEPILGRWRQVDLAARRTALIEDVDKAIAAEEAKEPKDDTRIIELRTRKASIVQFYATTKLLLEVDGDPDEFVRILVEPLDVKNVPISKVQPRATLESRWTNVKVLRDEETTSKAEKKKNRQSHILQLFGTQEKAQEQGYWRIETYLIPPKEGGKLFQLSYVRRMAASRHSKETAEEDELLAKCLIIP